MTCTIAASRWSGLRRRRDPVQKPKPKPSHEWENQTLSDPRRSRASRWSALRRWDTNHISGKRTRLSDTCHLAPPASVRVYLCLTACDMRKSFDGLHALVREHLEVDAFAGHLF
jgi:hypothetical protein